MQGPRRKWQPRIVLLTVALGLTAAAHLLAAMVGLLAALVLMLYLAERRRSYVTQILIFAALGALAILFAFYALPAGGVQLCVYRRGGAVLVLAGGCARASSRRRPNAAIVMAAAVALVLYAGVERQPLLRQYGSAGDGAAAGVRLMTTQVTAPWLWALPFLFTFIGGVFADALETRQRKMFLALTGGCWWRRRRVLAGTAGARRLSWIFCCIRLRTAMTAYRRLRSCVYVHPMENIPASVSKARSGYVVKHESIGTARAAFRRARLRDLRLLAGGRLAREVP